MTPLEAGIGYRRRGLWPVPIPPGEKGPKTQGWQNLRLSLEDLPKHFNGNTNIGLILVDGLCDVDLDCPEALVLSDLYLTPTGAEFGRASKPRSHRIYFAVGATFEVFADPLKKDKNTLLELRAGGGHQTLFPPSIADGERREWHGDVIAPAVVDTASLRRRCACLAVGCLVRRYISAHASERPGPDLPRLLWEFDPILGRRAFQWLGEPGPDEPRQYPKPRSQQSRQELDLAEIVNAIPNNCCWEEWNRIGMAIFAASGGSGHGGVIFDDWSAKSAKYNPYTTAERWGHFRRCPPTRIGKGTLVHLAQQAGWRPTGASS
jgi:hypothetical protein